MAAVEGSALGGVSVAQASCGSGSAGVEGEGAETADVPHASELPSAAPPAPSAVDELVVGAVGAETADACGRMVVDASEKELVASIRSQ